ncbi:MAG: hypothetical protein JOZ64_00945 [Solirubrobacterales bacterium]|nr:hypothetical protein [Solirubrobacterales bacterium]
MLDRVDALGKDPLRRPAEDDRERDTPVGKRRLAQRDGFPQCDLDRRLARGVDQKAAADQRGEGLERQLAEITHPAD